jgi:hypothetical protein
MTRLGIRIDPPELKGGVLSACRHCTLTSPSFCPALIARSACDFIPNSQVKTLAKGLL